MKASLKIIKGGKGIYPRTIVAELTRGVAAVSFADHNRRMVRRYSTPERALIGATKWMIRAGYVKDVITIYHEDSAKVYGVVKVTLKGRIKVEWEV